MRALKYRKTAGKRSRTRHGINSERVKMRGRPGVVWAGLQDEQGSAPGDRAHRAGQRRLLVPLHVKLDD